MALFSAPLLADQEVRLKSGASLIGEVSLDGSDAVVKIEGQELRVPLAEVQSVSTVGGGDGEAKRLLLAALEAQLLNGSGKEVIAVLAEAHRLAPDDARISFWYANALAEAGYPTGAKEVLAEQRDAIAKVFPGMADRLERRIEERLAFEKLPPRLFKRLDKLNAELARQLTDSDERMVAAAFRVVDQHEGPVDQAALQMNASISDEQLESYDNGYFLFIGKQHRSNARQPVVVRVADPNLKSAEFRLTLASDRVPTDDRFEVHRFDARDKQPYRIQVVTAADKPIAGAKVALTLESARGNDGGALPAVTTDAAGVANLEAFPLQYVASIAADGYKSEQVSITVPGDASPAEAPPETTVKLYRPLSATVRVEWKMLQFRPDQPNIAAEGKATLKLVDGQLANQARGYDPSQPQWIRPVQNADRLTLHFNAIHHGMYGNMPIDSWLRELEIDAPEDDAQARIDAALKQYKEIDLAKLDELKEKLEEPELPPGAPSFGRGYSSLPAEAGDAYVGKVMTHDPRSGPVYVAFKVVVEKVTSPTESAE